MASRVNTKFVIILVVGVLAFLGLLMLAWSIAYKSPSDLAKRGDAFMAQGEYKLAEKAYSKAVNKDATNTENLEKWIDALSHIMPETETEFRGKFQADYKSAIRSTATILRRDVAAHERYLKIEFDTLEEGYSRAQADFLITSATKALAFFDDQGGEPQEWERLKRYRGLPIYYIAIRNGLLEDDQYTLALDDLERASAANPDDAQSATALITMHSIIANRQLRDDDREGRLQTTLDSLARAQAYLDTHPNSIAMQIQQLLIEVTRDRQQISIRMSDDDPTRGAALSAVNARYHDRVNAIGNSLLADTSGQLTVDLLKKFYSLENGLNPEARLTMTRRLTDKLIDEDPKHAPLLMIAGKIANDVGDHEEAIGWYARLGDLEPLPLSFAGLRQYQLQKGALLAQATIKADLALTVAAREDEDDTELQAAIAEANTSRENYANTVSEEDRDLIILKGKAERASGNLEEALRLFKQFNTQTERLSSEGLWQEGGTAMQLGQYGVARKAMLELIPLDNTSRKLVVMLSLAQIDERLKDYTAAQERYQEIVQFAPEFSAALDGLERMNKLLNPDLNEDPELAAIYTARQIRQGSADKPADYAGAVEYLREAVVRLDYMPRVSQELASLLLDREDIAGARKILANAQQRNPDDDQLNRMVTAVNSNDTTDILIEMIRLSDRDELQKGLSIARIAADRNRLDLLDQTIQSLNQIAPDNRQVNELAFVNAIKKNDVETAKEIAAKPSVNQIDGLSYQARIAAAEENFESAIELLSQSIALGAEDASTYQMLATFQRRIGRVADAIQSYQQSLEIRPDNASAITDYLLILVQNARFEEALSVARRMQRYGTANTTFMSLWLNLESGYGGIEGREFAIRQRERLLELNPRDMENRFQLARMYIDSKNWEASRTLIDGLRAENDQLVFVELDATWHADQGVIDNQDAVSLANGVFSEYINGLSDSQRADAFIANSEFMLARGRADLAVFAGREAEKVQDPTTMLGSRLLGDLFMRINNLSEAVKAYKAVIDAGADPDFSIHYRLVETYTRLERFEEAREVYANLPEDKTNTMVSLVLLSDIEIGMRNIDEARRVLDRAVADFPEESYTYIKRAESMIGDETLFNDMLSDLSRALDLRPNDWRAYRVRAAGNFAIGRADDALDDLKSAIRLNPALDKSIFSLLNEMLSSGKAGEAFTEAMNIIAMRPDDATLMVRVGDLFSSRQEWSRAAEIYKLAWNKRHSVNDGALYIDALVRKSPPDAQEANAVINELANMVGNIDQSAGLLAAQALVLQARGRDDFALQQMTKAFDLSANKDADLVTWSGNLSRYFEGDDQTNEHVAYLEALKRRNTLPEIQAWLDLFIAQSLIGREPLDSRAIQILETLQAYDQNPAIRVQAYQIHGTTLFTENRFEEAGRVWEAGLALFEDDWQMNNNIAYLYSTKLNRVEDALEYGQRAIDKNIARSEAYETMAGIYMRLNRFDEADQMIQTGSLYLRGIRPRVKMLITAGQLEIARGDLIEANSKLNDAKAVLRASPEALPDLQSEIEAFEQEINSAQG